MNSLHSASYLFKSVNTVLLVLLQVMVTVLWAVANCWHCSIRWLMLQHPDMTWHDITWHCDSCCLIATFVLITIKRIIKILHVYSTMANTCLSDYGAGSQRYTQHALWMDYFFVLQPQTPCKYWHNHCWVKYAHFDECITYSSHSSPDVCPLRAAKGHILGVLGEERKQKICTFKKLGS